MRLLRPILAWLIILAAAATPFFSTQIRKILSIQAPAIDPVEPSTQLLITARYCVGAKPMLAGSPAELQKVVAQIQKLARSPLERFRLVPVLVELDQRDAARKTLESLASDPAATALQDDIDSLLRIYNPSPLPLTDARQSALIQRHAWFGQLAVSHAPGASADAREAVRIPAQRALWWMLAIGIAALVAVALGLGVLVLLIVLACIGSIQRRYVPDSGEAGDIASTEGHRSVYLECFALYLLLWMAGGLAMRLVFTSISLSYAWLLTPLVVFAICWPALNGRPWTEVRLALGWHAGRGWAKEVLCGFAGYLAFLPILVLGILLTSYLMQFSDRTPSHPLLNEITGDFRKMLGVYALACIFAPIIEETLFRGAFFHHLRRRWPWWVSAPIVAVIFAIIHPQGLLGLPVLILIALMLAALREWRGSLIAPATAHAINNFVATTVLFVLLA
ncbi:MAG: type II CAAX endopeptidase family protein [Tepidisphaeraceae bacterium]|jgi:membrane protease YdiL (CAAX protease family)